MTIGRRLEFGDSSDNQIDESEPIGRPIEFEKEDISRLRSIASALPKGIAKGLLNVAQFASALKFQKGPMQLAERLRSEGLEKILPTRPGFIEGALERTGENLPFGAGIGGSLAMGIGGELAKSAGLGETGQAIAEVIAGGLPQFGRKIIPTKGQEALVNLARKAGMTEKQIAPLLPEKAKTAFFKKIASKGEKTQKALQETYEGVGSVYNMIKSGPQAASSLTPQAQTKFLTDSTKILYDMPFEIRKQIQNDAMDLLKQGPSGENLINFYQDISSRYKMGREHLERLKKPILDALGSLSPELAEDFKMANDLYKRQIKIRKALKPNVASELMDLGEAGQLAYSIITLSPSKLGQFFGVNSLRKFSREMLINPRMQNIHKQMIKAANERKWAVVNNLASYIKDRYQEESSQREKSFPK